MNFNIDDQRKLQIDKKVKLCWWSILAVGLFVGILLWNHGPIPQAAEYHRFADQMSLLGIPNFQNVASNLPFMIVGFLGILKICRYLKTNQRLRSGFWQTWNAWLTLFVGVFLTSFGSAWYHLDPSNSTLIWDRLPMAIGFMGLFSGVLGDAFGGKVNRMVLMPLTSLGIGSVIYWYITELRGEGDLRLYLFLQFFPLLAILVILSMIPLVRGRSSLILCAILSYVLAKLLEHFDSEMYDSLNQLISGHALKHLFAALGCWFLFKNSAELAASSVVKAS